MLIQRPITVMKVTLGIVRAFRQLKLSGGIGFFFEEFSKIYRDTVHSAALKWARNHRQFTIRADKPRRRDGVQCGPLVRVPAIQATKRQLRRRNRESGRQSGLA